MANILPPLHKACSDDDLRPALQYVSIQSGIAYATNSYLIVAVNLNEHSLVGEDVVKALDGKFVFRETWQMVMDADVIEIKEGEIIYKKDLTVGKFEISTDVGFPDVHKILKDVIGSEVSANSKVLFNPRLVKIIADCFQSKDQLIMQFRNNNKSMMLFPNETAKQYALLVPMMEQQELPFEFDYNIL